MKICVIVKPNAKIEKVEKIPKRLIGPLAARLTKGGENEADFVSPKARFVQPKADFKVWVKEPAKEGKANQAVIKALAKYFSVPKSSVNIVSGAGGKQKIIEIKI